MRSVTVAESVLSRLTSAERAASFVGDLEELRPYKGNVWFWSSLLRVMLVHGGWRLVAMSVTFYLGARTLGVFQLVVTRANTPHSPSAPRVMILLAIAAIDVFLWMTFIYAAGRYGLRDRVSQLALLWAGLLLAMIVSRWHPAILLYCMALSLCLGWISGSKAEGRRAMLVVIATVVMGFACYLLASYAASRYAASGWTAFCLASIATLGTIETCSRTYAWMERIHPSA